MDPAIARNQDLSSPCEKCPRPPVGKGTAARTSMQFDFGTSVKTILASEARKTVPPLAVNSQGKIGEDDAIVEPMPRLGSGEVLVLESPLVTPRDMSGTSSLEARLSPVSTRSGSSRLSYATERSSRISTSSSKAGVLPSPRLLGSPGSLPSPRAVTPRPGWTQNTEVRMEGEQEHQTRRWTGDIPENIQEPPEPRMLDVDDVSSDASYASSCSDEDSELEELDKPLLEGVMSIPVDNLAIVEVTPRLRKRDIVKAFFARAFICVR